jgi:hypothetical protein
MSLNEAKDTILTFKLFDLLNVTHVRINIKFKFKDYNLVQNSAKRKKIPISFLFAPASSKINENWSLDIESYFDAEIQTITTSPIGFRKGLARSPRDVF